jgi:hypothetical protein
LHDESGSRRDHAENDRLHKAGIMGEIT